MLGRRHDYRPLAERLTGLGYALILMNFRCANDFVHAVFDRRRNDIALTLSHAERELGLANIVLFGTGLGGPCLAYFLSRGRPSSVKCVGFLSSIISPTTKASFGSRDHLATLDGVLAKSRALIAAGGSRDRQARDVPRPTASHMRQQPRWILRDARQEQRQHGEVRRQHRRAVCGHPRHERRNYAAAQRGGDSSQRAPVRVGAGHYLTQPGKIAEDYAATIAAWLPKVMLALKR
jgi:hypothetical protein